MTTFISLAKAHLASYKATTLGIAENGIWVRNSKPYPHILPASQKLHNLLPSIRPEFEHFRSDWKLHRDFHHLTSSQALAFNLFLPLVADWPGLTQRYSELLGLAPKLIQAMALEAVPDPEEGTNFDGLAELEGNARAYVEVKFTESGFGTAKANARRRSKLAKIYQHRLMNRIDDSCLGEQHFFAHYQLYRNLSALRPGYDDILVLLLPRAHTDVWEHAKKWSEDARLRDLRRQVRVIALEDVLIGLSTLEASPRFAAHARDLKAKYFVAAA